MRNAAAHLLLQSQTFSRIARGNTATVYFKLATGRRWIERSTSDLSVESGSASRAVCWLTASLRTFAISPLRHTPLRWCGHYSHLCDDRSHAFGSLSGWADLFEVAWTRARGEADRPPGVSNFLSRSCIYMHARRRKFSVRAAFRLLDITFEQFLLVAAAIKPSDLWPTGAGSCSTQPKWPTVPLSRPIRFRWRGLLHLLRSAQQVSARLPRIMRSG